MVLFSAFSKNPVLSQHLTSLLLLTLISLAYVLFSVNFSLKPYEDAAMLMRYAENTAQGNGIVWNINQKPVDGATDFLFLLTIAVISSFFSVSVESVTMFLLIVTHLISVCLVYCALVHLNSSRNISFLCALLFSFGPAVGYIDAYFGASFFGLFVLISWVFANKLKVTNSPSISVCFAISCLICGLIRPEGVLLSIFMLIAVVYYKGISSSKSLISIFLILFLILGGIYFIWRWNYFGHPFPNPFYKKGGGFLYLGSLKNSILNFLVLCSPVILIQFLILFLRRQLRELVFLLIPIILFTCIWILLSDEMNYLMRFQYPLFIISCFYLGLVISNNFDSIYNLLIRFVPKTQVSFFIVFLFLFIIAYQVVLLNINKVHYPDGRYQIAQLLTKYSNKNYTLVTTEAGLLPYYSKWNALDAWGLNDQWIAHNGIVTYEYLNEHHPEVVVFHTPRNYDSSVASNDPWHKMIRVLENYVNKNGYRLAGVFGETFPDVHYYYVRSDFADSDSIFYDIRNATYPWVNSGKNASNFVLNPSN